MRKKGPTKAQLQRELETVRQERDTAGSLLALNERKLENLQREHETARSLVGQIITLVRDVQPRSSLLPAILRRGDFAPDHTRMTPPPRLHSLAEMKDDTSLDVLRPINLHDLLIFLEEHRDCWERLVTIVFEPSTSGLSALRLQCKISDEALHSEAARRDLSTEVVRMFFRALDKQFARA